MSQTHTNTDTPIRYLYTIELLHYHFIRLIFVKLMWLWLMSDMIFLMSRKYYVPLFYIILFSQHNLLSDV